MLWTLNVEPNYTLVDYTQSSTDIVCTSIHECTHTHTYTCTCITHTFIQPFIVTFKVYYKRLIKFAVLAFQEEALEVYVCWCLYHSVECSTSNSWCDTSITTIAAHAFIVDWIENAQHEIRITKNSSSIPELLLGVSIKSYLYLEGIMAIFHAYNIISYNRLSMHNR